MTLDDLALAFARQLRAPLGPAYRAWAGAGAAPVGLHLHDLDLPALAPALRAHTRGALADGQPIVLGFDFSAAAMLATNTGWMMSAQAGFAPPWQLAAPPGLAPPDARRALMFGDGLARPERASWWAVAATAAELPAIDPRRRSLPSNKRPVLVADLDTGAVILFLLRAGLTADGETDDGPATLELPLAGSLDELVTRLRGPAST